VLAGITVTGAPGTKPTVTFTAPISVDDTQCLTLTEGGGSTLEDGDLVEFDALLVNARTATEYVSSYENSSSVFPITQQLLRGVRRGLVGHTEGSRVLIAITPNDGYGPEGGDPTRGLEPDDTLIAVVDIGTRVLDHAEGTTVTPADGVPEVSGEPADVPEISIPDTEPPTELVVQPLIEGSGAVVEAGQTIHVHYRGVLWGSGEEFDSSFGSTPVEFGIGQGRVIQGWDQGLVGQKVGSRVLLVIPPALGYGAQGAPDAGIGPTDTLVFVVDILHTRAP
jgi:peptidylprolyl isomerase